MPIHTLTSLDQPEIQMYTKLTENQLRNRLHPEQGLFIAESPKVIHVALNAGYQPLSLLCERGNISKGTRLPSWNAVQTLISTLANVSY
ncbi:TrmH family RNA methyltransferase [gut metagenome]|uniref:TrmH family RNA methyltransferase n=1 Tax=gut metagenome TaxID=749906 RepID=J9GXZ5_9ZZZZ